MKATLRNTLLDQRRFAWLEEEKKKWLQNLTLSKSIKMTEDFLSSNMFKQFKDKFIYDEPISLKLGLRTRKKNVRTRI
ncbi:MAG: hypothetical protein KAV18_03070 [Candidatus Omnitrophica bacterium]|nr:hypothetical protein [Candidatus Omnitrophota bacterium]MCK4423032.1 hypothetical protein [Candidatus Omnitrophota bacterium]